MSATRRLQTLSSLELLGISSFSPAKPLVRLSDKEGRSGPRSCRLLKASFLAFALCFLGMLTSCGGGGIGFEVGQRGCGDRCGLAHLRTIFRLFQTLVLLA